MPAKKRIRKQDILQAATEIIRTDSASALTMRSIAKQLDCSTQPLYSEFGSQEHLMEALLNYLHDEYLTVQCSSYRDYGRAFLQFAESEKELFRFLYLRRRDPKNTFLEDANLNHTIDLLVRSLDMERAQALRMHHQMQYYCYGLGTMIATGYRSMTREETDRELTEFFSLLLRHYKHADSQAEIDYWLERSRNSVL